YRPNFFDIELVQVGCLDLAKQNVLDLTRAERRVGGHAEGPESGSGERPKIACEKYHKRGFSQGGSPVLAKSGHGEWVGHGLHSIDTAAADRQRHLRRMDTRVR